MMMILHNGQLYKKENQSIFTMTTLTPDYLHLYHVLGLEAICTSNRDIIYDFNILNRQEIVQFFMTKTNEGYKNNYTFIHY
jgi:hypothetical protein